MSGVFRLKLYCETIVFILLALRLSTSKSETLAALENFGN